MQIAAALILQLVFREGGSGAFFFETVENQLGPGAFQQIRGALKLPGSFLVLVFLIVVAGKTPRRFALLDELLRGRGVRVETRQTFFGVVDLFADIVEVADVGIVVAELVRRFVVQRQFGRTGVALLSGQIGVVLLFAADGVDDARVSVFEQRQSLDAAGDVFGGDAETGGGFVGGEVFPFGEKPFDLGEALVAGFRIGGGRDVGLGDFVFGGGLVGGRHPFGGFRAAGDDRQRVDGSGRPDESAREQKRGGEREDFFHRQHSLNPDGSH